MLVFIKKIKQIFNVISSQYAFKVVEILGSPEDKNTKIAYQVNGKSTVVTDTPSQLVNQLMHLKGFSKKDSELIYNLDMSEKTYPSFRIIAILFENLVKFEIRDLRLLRTYYLTAEEILSEPNMIDYFSNHDVLRIYFQCLKDNEQAEKILRTNNLKTTETRYIDFVKETERNEF